MMRTVKKRCTTTTEVSIQETKKEKQENYSEKDTCTDKAEGKVIPWTKLLALLFFIIGGILLFTHWTDSDRGNSFSQMLALLDRAADSQDHLEAKPTKEHDKPTTTHSAENRQLSGRDSSVNNVDGLSQLPSLLDQKSDTQDRLGATQKKRGKSRTANSSDKRKKVTCRDTNGRALDLYYIYNLPIGTNNRTWTGEEYLFLSDKNWTFTLLAGENNLSTTRNPLATTLHIIYQQHREISVILYSDQPPNGPQRKDKGHTKGVIVFDNVSGFWLIHSFTEYPKISSYEWPPHAKRNGQSALCVTFPKDMFQAIAIQLRYMNPNVYYQRPGTGTSPFNGMADAIPPFPPQHRAHLTSLEGKQFIHYAKSASFNRDLYSGFVANDLKKKLYVETWRRNFTNESTTYIRSNCTSRYPVCNVAWVTQPGGHSFSYTKDHSKWAVTENGSYICIGDINRQLTQLQRGGGTMCAYLPDVAERYLKMIHEVEPCPEEQDQRCRSGKPFKKNKKTKKGKRKAKGRNYGWNRDQID